MSSMPDTFTDIEEDIEIQIPPTTSLADSDDLPVEFSIKGTPEHYVLLSDSYIHMKVKILKSDGSHVPSAEIVTPVNLLAHSMFAQCDLYLNENLVTKNNGLYPYKAYIGTQCAYSKHAKDSWLQSEMYFVDSPGNDFDSYVIKTTNSGLVLRNELSSNSRIIDMVFRPHVDMFMQSRPLPPNVDIRLRMTRTTPEFCLMSDGTKRYKLQIVSASLYVRVLKLAHSVTLMHKETLLHNGKMIYPIKRVQMQSFTIPSNILSHSRPNVIHGQLPRYIIMGITANDAFTGTYKKSPFRFSPHNLRKTNLIVNGRSIPARPYTLNFDDADNKGLEFIRCYRALCGLLQPKYADVGNGITRKMYVDGFTMIPFILTPDYDVGSLGLLKEGTVQLELEFAKVNDSVLNVVLYVEYENTVAIAKHGEISIDF